MKSTNIFLPALKQHSNPKKWYIAIPTVMFLSICTELPF